MKLIIHRLNNVDREIPDMVALSTDKFNSEGKVTFTAAFLRGEKICTEDFDSNIITGFEIFDETIVELAEDEELVDLDDNGEEIKA